MKIYWTQFKSFVQARKLDMLMLEDNEFYYLYASEDHVNIECQIDKHPSDSTDLTDFETNYKNICNPEKKNIIIPSSPLNDHEMKPYGLCHSHINSVDNHIYSIILSSKSGNDYTYSCSITPAEYDALTSIDGSLMDEIEEVEGTSIETFEGRLSEGSHHLIRPHIIDFKFPSEGPVYQLWGAFVHVEDYGLDDHICLQIIDIDNVLGYGNNFVLKEYDEMWASIVNKLTNAVYTPDGAPGDVVSGLYGRVLYYPKDVTKTNIKFWIDYILTIKS